MKKIWKYTLDQTTPIALEMPKDAAVLTVQMQGHTPTLWALVDPEAEKETRHFLIYGTGQGAPHAHVAMHVGTFQTGAFVWHLFEAPRGD